MLQSNALETLNESENQDKTVRFYTGKAKFAKMVIGI